MKKLDSITHAEVESATLEYLQRGGKIYTLPDTVETQRVEMALQAKIEQVMKHLGE